MDKRPSPSGHSIRTATEATIAASHHAIERARRLREEAMRAVEASERMRERVREQTRDRTPR